jgi:hypothetical protein
MDVRDIVLMSRRPVGQGGEVKGCPRPLVVAAPPHHGSGGAGCASVVLKLPVLG